METVALPLKPAPQLASGEAHVWYFQPETLPMPGLEDPVGAGSSLPLPARRMQQKFLLRLLLGAYLGCPGHAVRLGRSASGKPVLESPAAEAAPGFSLSHSRRWTAIVIGPEPLGLDIEEVDRPLRAVELARRWFSTAEFESLERAPERERNDRFLRFWTTREAMIKALGDTVGRAMREIELDASARGAGRDRIPGTCSTCGDSNNSGSASPRPAERCGFASSGCSPRPGIDRVGRWARLPRRPFCNNRRAAILDRGRIRRFRGRRAALRARDRRYPAAPHVPEAGPVCRGR